jgi:transcription initiation factor TFIIA large subunit
LAHTQQDGANDEEEDFAGTEASDDSHSSPEPKVFGAKKKPKISHPTPTPQPTYPDNEEEEDEEDENEFGHEDGYDEDTSDTKARYASSSSSSSSLLPDTSLQGEGAQETDQYTNAPQPPLVGDEDEDEFGMDTAFDEGQEGEGHAQEQELEDSDDDGLKSLGESDDDDEVLLLTDKNRQLKSSNKIWCSATKVTNKKGKWKIRLKDGIMHIQGKDHVFRKLNGDFNWGYDAS